MAYCKLCMLVSSQTALPLRLVFTVQELQLTMRCRINSVLAGIPFTAPFLRLHEVVLASYFSRQVKVAELPLDMYRKLQTLEWEDLTASEYAAC